MLAKITRTLLVILAFTALVGGTAAVAATSGPQVNAVRPPTLYVVNNNVGSYFSTVSVINASSGAFIKSIRVAFNATTITLAPNGRTAYVVSPNCGACMVVGAGAVQYLGTITPISTAANKALKPIKAVAGEIAITPNSKTAYVATCCSPVAGNYNFVTPINLIAGSRGREIKAGNGPSALAITPNGKTLYVSDAANIDLSAGTVTPVSIATGRPGHPIKVGFDPGDIAITPGSRMAYVANFYSGTVTAISVASNTAVKQIKTGAHPNDIAITPNGQTAYVANNGTDTVTAINTVTNKVIKQIKVGSGPNAIAIAPDGKTAYVAAGEAVVPIRTATNTALKPIKVRVAPAAIAVTPDGRRIWVSGGCGGPTPRGWAIAIAAATGKVGPSLELGVCPIAMAITG